MAARTRNLAPPTFKELLRDPVYRAMVLTPPKLPKAATALPNPWAIYALRVDGKWVGKLMDTYAQTFTFAKNILKHDVYVDLSIVSRRVTFGPPIKFNWVQSRYDWCSRCRRPSTFLKGQGLHALRGAVLTSDEDRRCFFCGIRRVSLLDYKPIRFTEAELKAQAKEANA